MSQLHKLLRKLRPRSASSSVRSSSSFEENVPYRRLYDNENPLYAAIQRHDMDQLHLVLLDHGQDLNVIPKGCDASPLMVACQARNLEALRTLVEHGGDVNVRSGDKENGATLLIVAATLGEVEIVRYLLDQSADIDCRCNQSVLDVLEADASLSEFQTDRAEILDAYFLNTPLIQACREGHLAVVKELLKRGGDANIQNANGNTALHVSCLGRTFYPYSTSRSQYVSCTFFLKADVKIIKELLKHGAKTNIGNHDSQTAIQRIFQVRCRPALQMIGWRFTRQENNEIIIRIFNVLRLLMQYGCNLPRGFWTHMKVYHDPELSKEIITTVKFAENFGLLPEAFPVIQDTMSFSLDNGCKYDPEEVSRLEEYDSGFGDLVQHVLPLVSCPRPLRSQCRTFLRSLLGSLHNGLSPKIVHSLAVPSSMCRFILGEPLES